MFEKEAKEWVKKEFPLLDEYSVCINGGWWYFTELFENFTYLDGSICGVKE